MEPPAIKTNETIEVNRTALWFAGVAFSTWGLVLGLVYMDFRESIRSGILPRAEERINGLEADYRRHVVWAHAEEQALQDRLGKLEVNIAQALLRTRPRVGLTRTQREQPFLFENGGYEAESDSTDPDQ